MHTRQSLFAFARELGEPKNGNVRAIIQTKIPVERERGLGLFGRHAFDLLVDVGIVINEDMQILAVLLRRLEEEAHQWECDAYRERADIDHDVSYVSPVFGA